MLILNKTMSLLVSSKGAVTGPRAPGLDVPMAGGIFVHNRQSRRPDGRGVPPCQPRETRDGDG